MDTSRSRFDGIEGKKINIFPCCGNFGNLRRFGVRCGALPFCSILDFFDSFNNGIQEIFLSFGQDLRLK